MREREREREFIIVLEQAPKTYK